MVRSSLGDLIKNGIDNVHHDCRKTRQKFIEEKSIMRTKVVSAFMACLVDGAIKS